MTTDFQNFINSLNEEQKTALASALNASKPPEPEKQQTKQTRVVNSDFIVQQPETESQRRKIPVKAKKNEWNDNGEFKEIETPRTERTPRNREKSKKIETECYICGKTFYVDPRYVYGEYQRCNRCIGK